MRAHPGRFRRADRLVRGEDFQRVSRSGQRAAVDGFVVVVAPRGDPGSSPRLGITMSRRVGGAVRRNRLKRWVREWFRERRADLRPGIDIVVIGRAGAPADDGSLAGAQLTEALGRAGGLAA